MQTQPMVLLVMWQYLILAELSAKSTSGIAVEMDNYAAWMKENAMDIEKFLVKSSNTKRRQEYVLQKMQI